MEIIRDGVSCTLTAEELEAAYREQQIIYRRADAADALDDYCSDLYDDELVIQCGKTYGQLVEDADLLDRIVAIFEASFTCDCDENTMWRNAVETALNESNGMYEVISASGKPRIIFANEFGIYEKVCTIMDQPAGRLTYWCNCLGEINVPGKPLSYSGHIDELPPDVQALYNAYQTETDGFHLYTVSLNGVNGMLFTLLVDKEWVEDSLENDMSSAYDALKAVALRIRDSEKFHSDVIILALEDTDPDGHELGIFFPARICEQVPEFLKTSVEFGEQIYQWIADEVKAKKVRLDEIEHYLRLRWTACYMLCLEDGFERADNAFQEMVASIKSKLMECDDIGALVQVASRKQFVKMLAQDLDEFIQLARKADALIELRLAQKVAEISSNLNNQ